MGLLECASSASVWKGHSYFQTKKVYDIKETSDCVFSAKVSGSNDNIYSVEMDLNHPRKSKCNCPHADGKRIICKHIVATYFTVLPDEAVRFYNEAIEYQQEEEELEAQLYDKVCNYILHMKKSEVQQELIDLLTSGPEWQYNRFIREHFIDY